MSLRLALLSAAVFAQDPARLEPVRHATCVRFYSLEGEVKADALAKAVAGLGTKDAEARISTGPSKVSSRPKAQFLALELPSRTPAKDVEAVLKRVCPRASELAWTAFQGPDRTLPKVLGFSPLECVVGMDNDVRWFDLSNGRARFFYMPGKLDAATLRSKFGKLYQPFDAGELGELVHEAIEWRLAAPLDPAAARIAEKSIAKIPGIRRARIDVAGRALAAEVEHDGLRGSAPAKSPAGAGFLADEILDVLDSARIAIEASAEPAPPASPR